MPGRKPKLRTLAEGDTRQRGRHKLAQKIARTPSPVAGLPECPAHLSGRAREAWEFWKSELIVMRIDSRCDAEMLEGACVAYQRAVDADLLIASEGITIREPVFIRGKLRRDLERIKKHPAVSISLAAWAQVRSFCSEFGLSPASRARLSVAKPSESRDDIEELLKGPSLTPEQKRALQ